MVDQVPEGASMGENLGGVEKIIGACMLHAQQVCQADAASTHWREMMRRLRAAQSAKLR